MKKWFDDAAGSFWTHRASYGCLACTYGFASLGVIDKDLVVQFATVIYTMIFFQRN